LANALVIGCSKDVWLESWQAKQLGKFDAVYCVKLAGVFFSEPQHFKWATLHPEFMDDYERQRAALCHHNDYEIIAPLANEVGMHGAQGNISRRVSYRYPGMNSSASSGGYAAKVALEDGYDRVVLAGIPMDADANHFTRGKPWLQRDSFTIGFKQSVPHFAGRVRSMSGWTMGLLGAPNKEWLNGKSEQASGQRQILQQDDAGTVAGRAPCQDGQNCA
jgi:hypothetical protein